MADFLILIFIAGGASVFAINRTAARIAVLTAFDAAVFILLVQKGVPGKQAFVYAAAAFFMNIILSAYLKPAQKAGLSPADHIVILINLLLVCLAVYRVKGTVAAAAQDSPAGFVPAAALAFSAFMTAGYFIIKKNTDAGND